MKQFWEERGSSISLNARKCAEASLDDVRKNELEVRGTMLGPTQAQQAFLETKLDKQVAVLSELPNCCWVVHLSLGMSADVVQSLLYKASYSKGLYTMEMVT